MFATGKTTFLNNFKDDIADVSPHENTIVVLADLAMEYWFDPDENIWVSKYNKPIYKGSREDKLPHIEEMIGDDSALWILESARYFGGLHEYFVSLHRRYKGGLKFIVPVCRPDTGLKFLKDRCELRNKTFRADYWTPDRLAYECMDRYLNPMKNLYEPVRVEYQTRLVGYRRKEWGEIGKLMLSWAAKPASEWYSTYIPETIRQHMIEGVWVKPDENLSDKGHKRQREDNDSQAPAKRVPRY
jgi:hypothetical protein